MKGPNFISRRTIKCLSKRRLRGFQALWLIRVLDISEHEFFVARLDRDRAEQAQETWNLGR